jgi:hypothetical protein
MPNYKAVFHIGTVPDAGIFVVYARLLVVGLQNSLWGREVDLELGTDLEYFGEDFEPILGILAI